MTEKQQQAQQLKENELMERGFSIEFVTMDHDQPPHSHRMMEIIYILNGHAQVHMEGMKYRLKPLDFIVIDASRMHEVVFGFPQTMGISIHISKISLRKYVPDIDVLSVFGYSRELSEKQEKAAQRLCEYMRDLTILYMTPGKSYELRSSALVLSIIAELVDHFGCSEMNETAQINYQKSVRVEQICTYVDAHYREAISLQTVADELGLSREYFCRFFKENMGISFVQYMNRVRIHHIYQDLIHSDDSVQNIMEKHGFHNQKLFYQMFKDIYDCTPQKLRTVSKCTPYI